MEHLECIDKQVFSHLEKVNIGLLIGTNCPKAIEPRDFVASRNGGPFAVLTIGPLYMSDGDQLVDCHCCPRHRI